MFTQTDTCQAFSIPGTEQTQQGPPQFLFSFFPLLINTTCRPILLVEDLDAVALARAPADYYCAVALASLPPATLETRLATLPTALFSFPSDVRLPICFLNFVENLKTIY